ncbi:MAG: hypothetical protein NT079_07205 [Candidatus Omnitrophica bacterium]|nr:hypothetical protein [Candidatus Omnitrophota bacterium]
MALAPLSIYHNQVLPLKDIPLLPISDFRTATLSEVASSGRIIAFFGKSFNDAVRLFMVLAHDHQGRMSIFMS